MAKNANDTDGEDDNNGADDANKTTEEDLRKLKYDGDGVDPDDKKSEDDTSNSDDSDDDSDDGGKDDGKTDDGAKDGEDDSDGDDSDEDDSSEFVKELPNIKGDTVADYARNLEKTIIESNKEGKRLADENAALKAGNGDGDNKGKDGDDGGDDSTIDLNNPVELFAKQEMDKRISEAFTAFQKEYPQAVPGTSEYAAFTNEVAILSGTILQSQKRLASPEELYNKAAVILGWEKGSSPTGKETLDMAVKGQAAVSKTSSSTKTIPKSKVTAEMIATNKKMYPNKSEEQIRKELEPYVNN